MECNVDWEHWATVIANELGNPEKLPIKFELESKKLSKFRRECFMFVRYSSPRVITARLVFAIGRDGDWRLKRWKIFNRQLAAR